MNCFLSVCPFRHMWQLWSAVKYYSITEVYSGSVCIHSLRKILESLHLWNFLIVDFIERPIAWCAPWPPLFTVFSVLCINYPFELKSLMCSESAGEPSLSLETNSVCIRCVKLVFLHLPGCKTLFWQLAWDQVQFLVEYFHRFMPCFMETWSSKPSLCYTLR